MSKANNNQLKLMKLGRRKKYLQDCILVSDLIDKHENEFTIRKRVFEKNIQPIVSRSYVTFNRMLNEVNPQKQIEEIERQILITKLNR